MRKRRIILTAVLMAVGAAIGLFFLWPNGPVNPETFAKLKPGMTEEEITEVIGLTGKSWRELDNEGSPFANSTSLEYRESGFVEGLYDDRFWVGSEFIIWVCFDPATHQARYLGLYKRSRWREFEDWIKRQRDTLGI